MKRKYENLEIICEGNNIHTGEDVEILLDGESILSKYGMTKIRWKMTSDSGIINMWYCKDLNTGEYFFDKEKDEILDRKITIKYPVKEIHLDFKRLGIISDNTPDGTEFYLDGKEFKESGIVEFDVCIGDADTITEIAITTC